MKPDIVVDVGNSRIKWGRCQADRVAELVALPPDDPDAWQRQLDLWDSGGEHLWAVSDVHPQRRDRLVEWLRGRGDRVELLDWPRLPLTVGLPHPERVGIDRLLNAVAASSWRRRAGAVLVSAGSAVTVDWLDEASVFRGGAIFPGLRLMAQALHEHTALLPLIQVQQADPPLPGTSTPEAMQAGIYWAAAGGIKALGRNRCQIFFVTAAIKRIDTNSSARAAQHKRRISRLTRSAAIASSAGWEICLIVLRQGLIYSRTC
jgi:type III pantothenate kinase